MSYPTSMIPLYNRRFRRPGRPAKYPWDKWLDGEVWILTKGKDFSCTLSTLRSLAFTRAGRRGLRVTTMKLSDETIALQAYLR